MLKRLMAWAGIALWFFQGVAADKTVGDTSDFVTRKVEVSQGLMGLTTATLVDIVYTPMDGKTEVEVYAPENLQADILVDVDENGMLVVRRRQNRDKGWERLEKIPKVRVKAPAVHTLCTSSSGDIILTDALQVEGLVGMRTNSSGDIKGKNIACDELSLSTNSSGDIRFGTIVCKQKAKFSSNSAGDITMDVVRCPVVSVYANSSGDIDGNDVTCGELTMQTNSSGDIGLVSVECERTVSVRSASSGDVKVARITATDVSAALFSCGNITLPSVSCTGVKVSVTSSGDMQIGGTCNRAFFSVDGSGEMNAVRLKADEVDVRLGRGEVQCHAVKKLSATSTYRGTVCYKGNPEIVSHGSSGMTIKKIATN